MMMKSLLVLVTMAAIANAAPPCSDCVALQNAIDQWTPGLIGTVEAVLAFEAELEDRREYRHAKQLHLVLLMQIPEASRDDVWLGDVQWVQREILITDVIISSLETNIAETWDEIDELHRKIVGAQSAIRNCFVCYELVVI